MKDKREGKEGKPCFMLVHESRGFLMKVGTSTDEEEDHNEKALEVEEGRLHLETEMRKEMETEMEMLREGRLKKSGGGDEGGEVEGQIP